MASKNDAKSADAKADAASDAPESGKSVAFTSPWGSKITVDADLADTFKDAGYKIRK